MSVQKTKQGYEISEHATQALANTVSEAHRMHGAIEEIASNSRLQNQNIQQITQSLTYIGTIGQKSAREAQKTHSVAETLRNCSCSMEEMIEELVTLVEVAP